jgi:hypothetical protein
MHRKSTNMEQIRSGPMAGGQVDMFAADPVLSVAGWRGSSSATAIGPGTRGRRTSIAEAGLAPVTRASGRTVGVRFRYAANGSMREAFT